MNWMKKFLTICTGDSNTYYTSVDLPNFYEWRFTGIIPKNIYFSEKVPRSESFMGGNLVIAARIRKEDLERTENGLQLKKECKSDIRIIGGNVLSPPELFYKQMIKEDKFNKNLNGFIQTIKSQSFFVSSEDKPKLYQIKISDQSKASVVSHGTLEDLFSKFGNTLDLYKNKSANKIGRSYELEDLIKFENYINLLKNDNNFIDATKIAYLIEKSGVKSETEFETSWKDIYLKSSLDAQILNKAIEDFRNFSWVKHISKYLNSPNK